MYKYFDYILIVFIFIVLSVRCFSTDSTSFFNYHFQQTLITQYKPAIHALYSGKNSLIPQSETQLSLTSTFFFGLKISKFTELYLNPEITAGEGLSGTLGVAGFPNGETYRVGNPKPELTVARIFLKQIIPLSSSYKNISDGINQIFGIVPETYLSIVAGKFSIIDYFDDNEYSHDPRIQFMNWSSMADGAWDFPANTKGYSWGITTEFISPIFSARFGAVMVPTEANQSTFDTKIGKANGLALEFEKPFSLFEKKACLKLLTYLNNARMGNYEEALKLPKDSIDITRTRAYGRTKYGFGLNYQQEISDNVGFFARAGWNDGNNETWAYTEIDRTLCFGLQFSGKIWNRNTDRLGTAVMVNGLSEPHEDYLKAGGYGFIIGDGNLNYGYETIFETYYAFFLHDIDHFWFSPHYQFILNPAYNKDRGPVNVFGLRVHIEF